MTSNTGFPWKVVTKGNRSSTRRNKKSVVRVAASYTEAEDKSSVGTITGASQPEKLGVSVKGHHLAERVKHVPIKKRRFMVRSPSTQREGSEHMTHINHAMFVSRLNPKYFYGRTSDVLDEKPDCSGHDFSGIEILASVACNSEMSNDLAQPVDSLPADQPVVQQQDASTPSTYVEGNDSSADVSQKYTAGNSIDQAGQGKNVIVAPTKSPVEALCNDLADEQSEEHNGVASDKSSTERSKADMEASDSGAVTVLEKSLADEPTEKSNESLKDVRLHWDLNVSMDAWSQPYDEASRRDVVGEITESIALKESELTSSSSGTKAEAAAGNDKECQSGYESQLEDGELREPYHLKENDDNTEEIEEVEKRKGNKGSDTEKHVMVCVNDSHLKKASSSSSSSSMSFMSRPFKEFPSQDAIHMRRPDHYEEMSTSPGKFVGRDDRSGMLMRNMSSWRGYYNGWDCKRRFSPPNYKGMMNNFNQLGQGPGPVGHVRPQFSNGGYRGQFRRFPEGGYRGPHGDTNQFPGWMRRDGDNSPVFRRLHYPQSESRSRSRSPVSWNGRNRLPPPPPPPGGFRATDERMMERVRFPANEEMGSMSRPRNRMSSPRFFEGRNNNDGEKKFRPGQRFDVGNSMSRVNPDNNTNHLRPVIRQRRFESVEEKCENVFEMTEQQRIRRFETTEDGGDDVQGFGLNGEQSAMDKNKDT